MDVLKPDILVIGGIRYRINPGQPRCITLQSERFDDQSFDLYDDAPGCEAFSDDEDIEEAEGGKYKCSFHISKTFFPYIIGTKASTKKRIETETNSQLFIPRFGHDGDIVVTATSKKNVASARRRIHMLVHSKRQRHSLTHFLSLPLNTPVFQESFTRFKNEVLEKFGKDRGITENIFQSPVRLHLTVSVLVLTDKVERDEAAEALRECKETVIRPLLQDRELSVVMSGTEIMNDDPSAASVLYGKVHAYNDDYFLQNFVDKINTFFSKKGLLVREKNTALLHCTLMNSSFLEKSCTFDSTNIMEHYRDFYFGKDVVSSLELSIMGSSTRDSYYRSTAAIPLS